MTAEPPVGASDHRKVLVIGARGFIGRQVVAAIERASPGSSVGGYREAVPPHGARCDLRDPVWLHAAMQGVSVVVNCARTDAGAADTRRVMRNLAAAATSVGVTGLIHLSSVAVYGSPTGSVRETDAPTAPLSTYGSDKLESEAILRQAASEDLHVIVLRPALVYGRGGEEWFDRFVTRNRLAVLRDLGPSGEGDANLVQVQDLVDLCARLALRPTPAFTIANVVGDDVRSFNTYFSLIATVAGAPPLRPRTERRVVWESRRAVFRIARTLSHWVPDARIRAWAPAWSLWFGGYDRYATRVRYATDRARELGFAPRFGLEAGLLDAMRGTEARP